jgi:hypothetical protein
MGSAQTFLLRKHFFPSSLTQPLPPKLTQTHPLINPHILPRLRQCFKNPRRQLIPNQARKNHKILRSLQQVIRQTPLRRVLVLCAEEMLAMAAATRQRPHEHVADVARDFGGEAGEVVGGTADGGEGAFCVDGEDARGVDNLFI